MSLGAAIGVALVGGLAAMLLARPLPRLATLLAVLSAAVVAGLGLTIQPDETLQIGGAVLAASDTTRLLDVGWAAGLFLLGLTGLAIGRSGPVIGAGLVALAAALLAVAVDSTTTAMAVLAVGGLVAVLVPPLARWMTGDDDDPPTALARRAVAAAVGAGLAGLVISAWSDSPGGPLGTSGLVQGDAGARAAVALAVVGIAAVVVLRGGAIPVHLWAARFVGVVSPLAVPSALAWGTAAVTLVAIRWAVAVVGSRAFALDDLDRLLILAFALANIVLGGLAAMLHDDLEHVLGYALVQDIGVALLAFSAPRPDVAVAAATWLIASAAVKTALAGWIAATRWAFGVNRLTELAGWARRAPLLGVASILILLGAVGLPGMALFQARIDLASAALPGWLAPAVVVVALSPLLVIGRLIVTGLRNPSLDVAATPDRRAGRVVTGLGGWSPGGPRWWLRAATTFARANDGLGVAVATILLAAVGLAIAIVGAGGPSAR